MSEIKWLHISDLHFDGAKAKYMFSWNEISGKDSGRFIDFLRQKHHMDWVKADYINKNGNGKIIKLTDGKNVISLHLINENTEVNLNFNNDIIDEFIVDTEKDQLNIYEKNLYDENKVLNPLLNTIEEKKPDLIFVTGDIGMSGEKKDYILAKKFFKDMLSRAKIKSDRLWIVPGNHDVERDIFLQRTIDSDKSVKFFGEPKARKHQITKFNSYVKFIQDMFPTRQLAECDAVHKPTVLKIGDFPIGILSLNSAWFSQGNDDKDNLWIGERMVRERSEQLEKQLKEEKCSLKLIIGILHHPFEYLHTSDTSEIWIRNNCKIVLRGHLHKMDAKIVIDTNGRALEIIGGPTYQGSGKPCRAFFTTFNTQSSIISLEPLMYLDKPTVKAWTVDTTVFTQYPYTMKYKLPLTYDNESDASDGVGSNGDNNNPIFPFSDWKYVNTHNWMLCITEWFKHAYDKDPEKSMKELIDHIFDIIIHIENNPSVDKNIKDLGKALFHSNLITIQEHHKNILKLLELGIQQDLPHLFMLPQVENNNLLKVPRYSQLILASRYLSAGYCEKSKELTKSIAKGCCIASYIYAQSARKMEIFGEAKYFLESNIDILEKNYKKSCFHKQECSFADGFKLNCNYDLMKAESYRALGVVYRKLGEKKKAEINYKKATRAANSAIESEKCNNLSTQQNSKIISGTYGMMPSRVLADVYYSHGYYLYEENKFRKAAQLFTKSIQTLEDIHEEWDAPYIRLAIIKLGSKNVKDKDYSYDLFSKSRIICDHTDCTKNRESKLGLALCTLGLNIIDIIKEKPLSNYDAIGDLEKGILFEPPLSIGALKCHLHDAKNLDEIIKNNLYPGNFKIVEDFIALLEKEIKTTTNKNTACKSTTCLDQTSSSSCPNK